MDYSNIPTGLKITSQIPLDVKKYVKDESTLAYLGVDNNLAFTYHDQLEVLCLTEKKIYQWREVQSGEENTGLIPLDFTYPLGLPEIYNISYSGKTYNFFLKTYINSDNISEYVSTIVGPPGPTGPTGPTGPQGPAGADGEGLENLQKTVDVFPYTLTNADDKYTIFLENGVSLLSVVNIPENLVNNFSCVFIQKGTGDTQIGFDHPSLFYGSGLINVIKGQYYWALLEKELATENYYLTGSLKTV